MNGEIASTYQLLSTIAFGVAALCFAIAIYLLFRFKIIKIINDLSVRTARKTISKIREQNEQSGSKFYGPHAAAEQRGKITDKMKETGEPDSTDVLPDSDSTDVLPDYDTTDKLPDEEPTDVLQKNIPIPPQVSQGSEKTDTLGEEKNTDVLEPGKSTDVLDNSYQTDTLSTSSDTDVLNPSEINSNLTEELDEKEKPTKKSSLKPVTSVVLIHTDERI